MTDVRQDTSDEKRRRLLKGALGASTVMTLGYGGTAAAASMSCVANVRELVSGGPPANTLQFTLIDPGLTTNGSNWGWLRVDVRSYKLETGSAFDAFEVLNNVYRTSAPSDAVVGATLANNQNHHPTDAWVLAYFTDNGDLVGTYPTHELAAMGATPATGSCLASVNPSVVNNLTFGG